MLFRTQFRTGARIEATLEEDFVVNNTNAYLEYLKLLSDKKDSDSIISVDFSFILSILNGTTEHRIAYCFSEDRQEWDEFSLNDTIEDYVRELFNETHWEIVDLGDVVEEEYEEGDF